MANEHGKVFYNQNYFSVMVFKPTVAQILMYPPDKEW